MTAGRRRGNAECGCRHSFTPEKRTHIFYSDDCQYRHYRKLHAKELDAAATVYYQAHKKEIAARTQKHREDPEVRERIHAQGRAWRASNPDKVKEKNARFNAARVAKLAETERLKNLEGLDLKTGLRISLTAHRWLEGAKSLYDMKDDVYPDSVDAFNAIKQLDRRFHAVIEDEQQRIAKLSDEQRRADADCRRIRLSQELNKPKK